ncbi:GMP synthase (glutamine-hydrolysing) [Rhizoctonia solani]|uniref:GMP synthase (Glutamine-hydrolysing) n=1 Tax=Rhizoctonia solani TaxID=456999 RepID=A0A8H8NPL3_9AGAM|nr:GMP synthase (glutamine-hydrolyzing) [Rhizoctonia solani]QRW17641.1 GMP synthase (glutamine-hydrolysing) [Rhizoctonia solani]
MTRKNIRSLSVIACTLEPAHWIAQWLANLKQACFLRELSVVFYRDAFGVPVSVQSAGSSLDLSPFANELHILRLGSININWTAYTFTRLCVLKLIDIRLNIREFQHILASAPIFEVLELTRGALRPPLGQTAQTHLSVEHEILAPMVYARAPN